MEEGVVNRNDAPGDDGNDAVEGSDLRDISGGMLEIYERDNAVRGQDSEHNPASPDHQADTFPAFLEHLQFHGSGGIPGNIIHIHHIVLKHHVIPYFLFTPGQLVFEIFHHANNSPFGEGTLSRSIPGNLRNTRLLPGSSR